MPCRDKPEDLGFPAVEPTEAAPKKDAAKASASGESLWDSLYNNVLTNPFIWGMALTYFFIYIVRQVRGRLLAVLLQRLVGKWQAWWPCL